MARFGGVGLPPISRLVRRFQTPEARGLFAGVGAHAVRPLTAPFTSAFGLVLAIAAHTVGWPVVEGGSARLVEALTAELSAAGGTVTTGRWVTDLKELPHRDATVLDTSPRTLASLAKDRLPARYHAALSRFPYGPGFCKVDWALSGAVPWSAEVCRRAGTVHVGGTFEEIARPPRRRWRRGDTQSGPSASWCSPASSIPPAHRRAATPCGATATSRTAPRSTPPTRSSRRSRGSRRGSATSSWREPRRRPRRPRWSTRTTSAAT